MTSKATNLIIKITRKMTKQKTLLVGTQKKVKLLSVDTQNSHSKSIKALTKVDGFRYIKP